MNKYKKALNTIIDAIRDYVSYREFDSLPSENEIFGAMKLLRKLVNKADAFEWIPVSERLPEPINEDDYNNLFDVYLVSVGEESNAIRALWDGRCFCDAMFRVILDVKAWMPLPKPYEEKENDS